MQTLKPCPFCSKPLSIRGGVNPYGRCNTEGCWMMEAKLSVVCDDPKQTERWNTRHAAPVEGLEVVGIQHLRSVDGKWHYGEAEYANQDERELVTRSQAEAIISAERVEKEQATKELKQLVVSLVREHFPENEVFKPLDDLLGLISQIDNASTVARSYVEKITSLQADNAALTARVTELEGNPSKHNTDTENLIRKLRKEWPTGPGNRVVCATMEEAADTIESLETQLAAARGLISRAQEIIPGNYMNWHGFARAALGGKP